MADMELEVRVTCTVCGREMQASIWHVEPIESILLTSAAERVRGHLTALHRELSPRCRPHILPTSPHPPHGESS